MGIADSSFLLLGRAVYVHGRRGVEPADCVQNNKGATLMAKAGWLLYNLN